MPKQSSKSTASKKVTSTKLKALDNLFTAMKKQAVYELTNDDRFVKANARSALLFHRYIKTKGPIKTEGPGPNIRVDARLYAYLDAFVNVSLAEDESDTLAEESDTFDAYEQLYDRILENESKKLK